MIVITASEFRSKTGYYADLLQHQDVAIRFRDKGLFKLVPVDETKMTKEEFEEKLEKSRQQISEGKCTVVKNRQELLEFLESL